MLWLAAIVVLQRCGSEDDLPAFLAVYAPQPPLLLPVVAMMALCLLRLRWRWFALNAALLVTGVALLIPPMLPGHRLPALDPATRIRVVTWNVHEEFRNTQRLQETLDALKPDVVCLQEARQSTFRSVLPGAEAAHTHDVTTLTRGKIVARRAFPLGRSPNFRWGMDTDIVLPQGRLRVLNLHYMIDVNRRVRRTFRQRPSPPVEGIQRARTLENEVVTLWLKTTPGPRIVAGDFNTPPRALIYRQLAAVATDAFAAVGRGWGFTFRRDQPVIRIDYVWCAGGVKPLRSAPRDGGLSDHRLLVTDLYIPGGASPRRVAAPAPGQPTALELESSTPEDTR
ncbi:MAG: endonuclease/exonuclease/phosphatase family protein [Armatimonadota bacterium]